MKLPHDKPKVQDIFLSCPPFVVYLGSCSVRTVRCAPARYCHPPRCGTGRLYGIYRPAPKGHPAPETTLFLSASRCHCETGRYASIESFQRSQAAGRAGLRSGDAQPVSSKDPGQATTSLTEDCTHHCCLRSWPPSRRESPIWRLSASRWCAILAVGTLPPSVDLMQRQISASFCTWPRARPRSRLVVESQAILGSFQGPREPSRDLVFLVKY